MRLLTQSDLLGTGDVNCTAIFFTDKALHGDSFGLGSGLFYWDGGSIFITIRDAVKVGIGSYCRVSDWYFIIFLEPSFCQTRFDTRAAAPTFPHSPTVSVAHPCDDFPTVAARVVPYISIYAMHPGANAR